MNHTLCLASTPAASGFFSLEHQGICYNCDLFLCSPEQPQIYCMLSVYPFSGDSFFSHVPFLLAENRNDNFSDASIPPIKECVLKWTSRERFEDPSKLNKSMNVITTRNMIVIEKKKENEIETTVIAGIPEGEELEEWKRSLREESLKEEKLRTLQALLNKKVS